MGEGKKEEEKEEEENSDDRGIKPAEATANASGMSNGSGNAVEEREGSLVGFSTCGTTSLVVVVSDLYVMCCNTGDSR